MRNKTKTSIKRCTMALGNLLSADWRRKDNMLTPEISAGCSQLQNQDIVEFPGKLWHIITSKLADDLSLCIIRLKPPLHNRQKSA